MRDFFGPWKRSHGIHPISCAASSSPNYPNAIRVDAGPIGPAAASRRYSVPGSRIPAAADDRIKALRKIAEKKPKAGWRLLLSLLPALQAHSMPTHTPRWRNWAFNWRLQATDADFARQVQACGDQLVDLAGNDPQRWSDIIEHIADLPATSRSNALSKLAVVEVTTFTIDDRKHLAEKLREQIHRHRAFPDAFWALAGDDVAALETALKRIEPDDLVVRSAWLFADHVELPDLHALDGSWEKNEAKISQLRQEAIRTIFADGELSALLRLAATAKNPSTVGVAWPAPAFFRIQAQFCPTC